MSAHLKLSDRAIDVAARVAARLDAAAEDNGPLKGIRCDVEIRWGVSLQVHVETMTPADLTETCISGGPFTFSPYGSGRFDRVLRIAEGAVAAAGLRMAVTRTLTPSALIHARRLARLRTVY